MRPPEAARQHSARRTTVIAGVIATLTVLAGCSSSGDSAEMGWDTGGSEPSYVTGEDFYAGDEDFYATGEAEGSATEHRPAAERAERDRSVIVTGELYITVDNPIEAAKEATDIVRDGGGRVDGRSETSPYEGHGGSAELTLRIPADQLDATISQLRELGTVDEYRTDSYDVTTEVTDLEAQISTLRASTKRIEALLTEAADISDIIKLESELDGRQAKLEGLEARQRGLNDQVSMSTIEMSLTTEPVVIVDNEPTSFWDGLVSGWNGLVSFLTGALVAIGMLLPWIALIAIVTLVVVVAIRARIARGKRRNSSAPQATAAPAQATDPVANSGE